MQLLTQIRNLVTAPSGTLPMPVLKVFFLLLAFVVFGTVKFCSRPARSENVNSRATQPVGADVNLAQVESLKRELDRLRAFYEQARDEQESHLAEAPLVEPQPPRPSVTYRQAPTPPAPYKDRDELEERRASNIVIARAESLAGRLPEHPAPAAPKAELVAEKPAAQLTYRVREGTLIESMLLHRLDGTFTGPVDCVVTTPVYSEDRQSVLIPQGSRVLGRAERVDTHGQQRLAVVFHRLFLPNGTAYDLKHTLGLNGLGETGLRDKVDHHYGRLFGTSAALGLLGGLAFGRNGYGANASGADLYFQSMASSASNSATHILNRQQNVLPTLSIQEGHRVLVYLTADLQLPAYRAAEVAQ